MSDSKRQIKFGRMVRSELSNIFLKHISPPSNVIISVSFVRMSTDLSIANVYLSIYPAKDCEMILQNILSKASEIRYYLGKNIRKEVRHTPSLRFFYDDLMQESSHVNDIMNEID